MVKIYQQPFAHAGTKQIIPDASDPQGFVSNADGFTTYYELPDTHPNYKPIERAEFNGLINTITESLGEIQQFGFAKWQPMAWPQGARVVEGGVVYRALVQTSQQPPHADWQRLDNFVRSVNGVGADANGNVDIIVFDATTEIKGKVQLCDDIEQNATNKTMAVTPHAVASYVSAGGKKANDIGIVGRQGFGVSFPDATEDELATIGMTPMNGTYDKTSDNYGNFMSNNGGVFVYIPHYYVRYGEQTEADYEVYGANVLGVKSHDAYNSEAEANTDGYFSPRAFYDGSESVNQQGFFMQKYEHYAKTVDGVIYPYGDGSARGMINIIPPDMMTRARNLGSDYFVASYFMHQAMDTITLLQGQHSTGTANCAWWKSR